jgi:hypothetical protein
MKRKNAEGDKMTNGKMTGTNGRRSTGTTRRKVKKNSSGNNVKRKKAKTSKNKNVH